ncbi:MAG TPA: EamA family transporter [Rhizomicrobium sp.]|jgi:O-acetylserine/cysteine efflux transporter|nr:EamA family transporter [Rhizomicrobium sp.]
MTNKSATLPLPHILLALAVIVVWGTNFPIIKLALAHLPPLAFATLRFVFAFLPAALFLKRPAVPPVNLATYGILIGAGQFGILYIAMKHDISPGLASLVMQVQVFFTIGLAMWFGRERVRAFQVGALVLAAVGLGIIVVHGGADATPLGLGLTLVAAASWAGGNMVARASPGANMLAYVVWASVFSIPPLAVLSLLFEGWPAIRQGIASAGAATWAAVLYQSWGNTLFGFGSWAYLLARHPAATVSPFALLVPVVGMTTATLTIGEAMPMWKLGAAALVMAGLILNLTWPRLVRA